VKLEKEDVHLQAKERERPQIKLDPRLLVLKLKDKKFLLFKTLSLWYFAMAAQVK
jgi:hypothetical protein